MKLKTKKRLIALAASFVIILLSIMFGQSAKQQEKEESTLQNINLSNVQSFLGKNSGATTVVLAEGDENNVIQKITVEGEIGDEMIDEEITNSIINQIKYAKEDSNVKAILLSVNTPGGGVYASYEIYNALKESGKDVYVSMKHQATSGGYYISMAAKKIFATDETITGSIGVIASRLSAQQYLEEKGIKNQIIRSGEQKAVGGLTEDMPDSTIAIYKDILMESYEKFVDVIVEGRNMNRDNVYELADGRIYSGKQAVKNGLIDKIGNEKDLIQYIKEEKGLTNPKIIEHRKAEKSTSFLDNLVSAFTKTLTQQVETKVEENNKVQLNYLG